MMETQEVSMKRINPTLTPELWRLSIIGDLIHRHPDDGCTLAARLSELAAKTWIRPDGTPCQFSHETLRKWHSRFQAGGLAGLTETRSCPGTQIPEQLGDALIDLRRQHPNWTVMLLIEELQKKGVWNGRNPSQASLYRWCKAKGLLRSREAEPLSAMAFEFTSFGALWLSDVLHGPKVTVSGKKRKAYLLAILDDASRFVVSARFHLSEGIEPLIIDLRQTLIRFGVPQRFYTDNGAAFRSRIIHQVGARLGIAMPHTPPYQPKGRGKIERFFLTVRQRFLAKNTARTLEQLNRDLQEWVAEYHQTSHGGIGDETPLNKRLRIEGLCRALPENTNIDGLFMQSRQVRLNKDGTFRLQNQIFEAPQAPRTHRVEIFFYPWDLSTVFYGLERRPAKLLDKHANARRFENPNAQEAHHE
jgi:transposase InsO family protein